MLKSARFLRFVVITGFCFLSVSFIHGQDLGSSSGLFRASNPKAKKTTPAKKTPVKPKSGTSAANRNSNSPAPKKSTANTPRSANQAGKPANNRKNREAVEKPSEPIKDVVITVGGQTNDFEEIYEQSIEEGNFARDRREYKIAETAYIRAKAVKSTDFRAVYGLGNIYSDQQLWEEAEIAYREAIGLAPEIPEPYIAISFVLTQPIVGKDLSVRFLEAQKMARRAIELDPSNPFAYDQLGVALELSGNIDKRTFDAYQKAVTLDPEFALAYAHLGRLLRRNGKVKESGEAYARAIKLANDVPTMILVADVLQSQQKYDESEDLLRRALREDGKNPTALFLLGRALTVRSAFAEAETVLKRSIEISPKSLFSYMLLGSVYSRRGDFVKAENILIKALQVVSENEKKRLAQEFETVGDGFFAAGRKRDAVRAYRQAVALDSDKNTLNDKLTRAQKE